MNERAMKKLKERQDALAAAPSNDLTASEWQMKEERDKLLVCSIIGFASY